MQTITGFGIFAIAVLGFVIVTLMMGVRQVPQGFNYTVERFGKYATTLTPGLALIIPWIDRIGRKMNMMEQVIDVPSQEVITRDNATVTVDGVVFFQVLDAARASYEVANLQQALLNYAVNAVKFTTAGRVVLRARVLEEDDASALLLLAPHW